MYFLRCYQSGNRKRQEDYSSYVCNGSTLRIEIRILIGYGLGRPFHKTILARVHRARAFFDFRDKEESQLLVEF